MQVYDFHKTDGEVEVIEREAIKSDDSHITNLSPDFIKNIQDGMKIKTPIYQNFMVTDHKAFKQWIVKIYLNKDPSKHPTPFIQMASKYCEVNSTYHKQVIIKMIQEIFNTVKG